MRDSDASDGTSSASEASGVELPVVTPPLRLVNPNATAKKRKTTYTMRKDEIRSLEHQIRSLQAQLRKHEDDMPIIKYGLRDGLLENAALARSVEQTSLSLAGMQSMMTAHAVAKFRSTGVVPLRDSIHLPADATQRHAILAGMRASKLRSAAQFMAERTRFLDLSVPHKQIEQFELPDGQLCLESFDVTQFSQGHSIRQVYDALMSFVATVEMSISEKLGVLTVRESDEIEKFTFAESRFLSSVPGGREVESNIVTFATCVDATPEAPGFAVDTMDFVDQDDLHPYRPDLCLRKKLTGAVTLQEIAVPSGGKPTIVMARWSHIRVLPAQFEISEEAARVSRYGICQWCELIPRIMKEQLAAIPPAH